MDILLILQTLGTLVHVGMPQNGIHHEGICALAKSFSKNPKMQVRKTVQHIGKWFMRFGNETGADSNCCEASTCRLST